MSLALLCIGLSLSGAAIVIAMLIAIHQRQAYGAVPAGVSVFIERAWATLPWFIVALCAAQAIHQVLGVIAG